MTKTHYPEQERPDPRHYSNEREESHNFKLLLLFGDRRFSRFHKENRESASTSNTFALSVTFTENAKPVMQARQRNFVQEVEKGQTPAEVAAALRKLADKIDGGYPQ